MEFLKRASIASDMFALDRAFSLDMIFLISSLLNCGPLRHASAWLLGYITATQTARFLIRRYSINPARTLRGLFFVPFVFSLIEV